jgi:hypothetical protein
MLELAYKGREHNRLDSILYGREETLPGTLGQ